MCCIIGGLGNVRGAFLAALMLGVIESLTTVMLNGFPGLTVYVGMVLALLFRPQGLFSSAAAPETAQLVDLMVCPSGGAGPRLARDRRRDRPRCNELPHVDLRLTDKPRAWLLPTLAALGIAAVASLPAWANPGLMFLAGLTVIEALFALSWNFLFGYAGVVSFGHAAFFAIGAYGVGALLKAALGVPFLLMLVIAALAGAAVAALVGVVALKRASGIYLAILTMSLAEIFRIVVGYRTTLGRDDGLAAIPRPVLHLGVTTIDLSGDVRLLLLHPHHGRALRCAALVAGPWPVRAGSRQHPAGSGARSLHGRRHRALSPAWPSSSPARSPPLRAACPRPGRRSSRRRPPTSPIPSLRC